VEAEIKILRELEGSDLPYTVIILWR